MNEDEYKTVAIVAAALLAPKLYGYGEPNPKRDQLMQEAIGDARSLLGFAKEIVGR